MHLVSSCRVACTSGGPLQQLHVSAGPSHGAAPQLWHQLLCSCQSCEGMGSLCRAVQKWGHLRLWVMSSVTATPRALKPRRANSVILPRTSSPIWSALWEWRSTTCTKERSRMRILVPFEIQTMIIGRGLHCHELPVPWRHKPSRPAGLLGMGDTDMSCSAAD